MDEKVVMVRDGEFVPAPPRLCLLCEERPVGADHDLCPICASEGLRRILEEGLEESEFGASGRWLTDGSVWVKNDGYPFRVEIRVTRLFDQDARNASSALYEWYHGKGV